jgi:hypothetical protein
VKRINEAIQEFVEGLRPEFAGEIRTDTFSRFPFSTDASLYQIEPPTNWVMRAPWARCTMQQWMGIHPDRHAPAFARRTFRDWLRRNPPKDRLAGILNVVLFNDTFINYNEPWVGIAAPTEDRRAEAIPRHPAITVRSMDRRLRLFLPPADSACNRPEGEAG